MKIPQLASRSIFLALPLLLASATWCGAVTVTVDANQVLRTVDDRMFGLNTAVWDGQFKSPTTVPFLQAIDIRVLRFPGGSTSDTYDWQTNRSYQSGTRTLNNWSWTNSFDEFAQVARTVNAQAFITVNYGSGTAQQAADWVTYSNVTKGYGFKYWEIGNECYGSWEEDIHPLKWDPVTYATEARDYITKMKAADPTIKIGVVIQAGDQPDSRQPAHSVTNPRTGASHRGWTAVMLSTLKSLGVAPDFAIYHRYPLAPMSETDAKLLSGVSISNTTWADDVADLRRQLDDFLGAATAANVELVVTENNDVYSEPGKQSTSLVNGLFLADSFGQLLQTEFKGFVWWGLRNGSPRDSAGNLLGNFSASLYGWRAYGDYGVISTTNDPHPTYYALKLLRQFARGSDNVVKATSSSALLATYAVRRTDGSLTLLVINKDPAATAEADFTVTGFTLGGSATVYTYGIPQDEAAHTGTGEKDLANSNLMGLGATFHRSFAPYSATVIALAPATPSAPTQLAGFGSAPTETTLTWQRPTTNFAGLTGYALERATDTAFTQGVASVALGAVTSYVDQGLAAGTRYYYRVRASNPSGASGWAEPVSVTTLPGGTAGSARLVNISARARCGTGDNVAIGGFVILGSKRVLLRAVGPSLTAQGLGAPAILADPTIEVHASAANGGVSINDNWGENTNAAEIPVAARSVSAGALLDTDSKSSAWLATLNTGVYSFVVRGKAESSGIVLLEVYDAGGDGRFANIATRAEGRSGDEVAIGGFVISGTGIKRVLIRAVGSTLTTQGLSSGQLMADPVIELHDAWHGNVVIATNDNWVDNGNADGIRSTGARIGALPLAATDSTSSALLVSLPAGAYSFVARGQTGSGIVLVEIYDAD